MKVYEAYLARRWEEAASMLGPVPSQSSFDRTARRQCSHEKASCKPRIPLVLIVVADGIRTPSRQVL
eukprot:5881170-Amphidinium_carterae.1